MRRDLVFTAYNRLEYLQQTITTWNGTRNLRNWNATFFIEPSDVQDTVVDIALALDTNTTTRINETVQGVLVNPWNALDTAFTDGADFVVLAEDDVIVSQDTLEYFEWASVEYETAKRILMLNAFSDVGGPKANQLMQAGYFSPLIWGVWRDRWYDWLRDTWDKDYSTGLPDGSQAGWDWNINRIMATNNLGVIKPLQSRSSHIGLFGTHMTPADFESAVGIDFEIVRGRQRYIEV